MVTFTFGDLLISLVFLWHVIELANIYTPLSYGQASERMDRCVNELGWDGYLGFFWKQRQPPLPL